MAAPGVINLAPARNQVATYTPDKAHVERPKTFGYKPDAFNVTPEQTVYGQLDRVYREDSPLLQQARVRAAQQANSKGLLNSSGAINAGEQAVIAEALKIATPDADKHFTANTNTVQASNAAKYAKMQADNNASIREAELSTNVNLANADAHNQQAIRTADAANQFAQTDRETSRALALSDRETDRSITLSRMDRATRESLANLDRGMRLELAGIENNYRQLLQLDQSAASMFNQISTNIANISNSNLSPEAKDAAIETQMNMLRQSLQQASGIAGTSSGAGRSGPNVSALNIGQYFTPKPSSPNTPSPTPANPGTPPPRPAVAQPNAPPSATSPVYTNPVTPSTRQWRTTPGR